MSFHFMGKKEPWMVVHALLLCHEMATLRTCHGMITCVQYRTRELFVLRQSEASVYLMLFP